MINKNIFKLIILYPLSIILLYFVFTVSFVQAAATVPIQILFSANIQGETEPCG